MAHDIQACPHCGAVIGYAGDAFCSDCRGPLDDPPPAPDAEGQQAPPFDLGVILPINATGFVMLSASFFPTVGLCQMIGDDRDGLKLVIGGPLAIAIDLVYRLRSPDGKLFSPDRGGKFAYLPLWMFGIFWLCYGAWQLA